MHLEKKFIPYSSRRVLPVQALLSRPLAAVLRIIYSFWLFGAWPSGCLWRAVDLYTLHVQLRTRNPDLASITLKGSWSSQVNAFVCVLVVSQALPCCFIVTVLV